jgi:cyclopropane-fatty-acyl-phospholipid synthase
MSDIMIVNRHNVDVMSRGLPLALRLALRFTAGFECGCLEIGLPDGRRYAFVGRQEGPSAAIEIRNPHCAWRVLASGDLGAAEGYLRGEWDTPDLSQLLYLFVRNSKPANELLSSNRLVRLWQRFGHWRRRNTLRQARRNIHAHYDLGNRFYAAWLDPSMTYSSAIYGPEADDLKAAQERKYRTLAEGIGLAPDQRVLEVGCGWGGFAEFVARSYGVRVTALTISRAQHDYASRRIFEAGLSERVEIKFQDYREAVGIYDRIASIEMIEAVGEAHWPGYFAQLRDRLGPDGRVGIQAITIQNRLFAEYRRSVDFIRGYVFPGGMLPAPQVLVDLGRRHGLTLAGEKVFGQDYVRTLSDWRSRFRSAWPSIEQMGFDERFRRLWEYYLAYSEAGFRSGMIDVRQMVFVCQR